MTESEEPSSRQHLQHLLTKMTEAKPHKLVLPQNNYNIIVKQYLDNKEYKNYLFELVMERLKVNNCHVRYLTMLFVDTAVRRSKDFRKMVFSNLNILTSCCLENSPVHQLPEPKEFRQKLINTTLNSFGLWKNRYDKKEPKLLAAAEYITDKLHLTIPNISKSEIRIHNQEVEESLRKQAFYIAKFDQILKEYESKCLDAEDNLNRIKQCFEIIIPNKFLEESNDGDNNNNDSFNRNPLIEPPTKKIKISDISKNELNVDKIKDELKENVSDDYWDSSDEGWEEIEIESYNKSTGLDLLSSGIDPNTVIQLIIKKDITIEFTRDTEPVISCLIECRNYLKKLLDNYFEVWENVLSKIKREDVNPEKYEIVKKIFHPIYIEVKDVLEKCKDFRIIGYSKETVKEKPNIKRRRFQSTPEKYWICDKCNYPNVIKDVNCIACDKAKS